MDHRLPPVEVYKRIGKSLITGLRVQRTSFFAYRAGELRLLTGKGSPEPAQLSEEGRNFVERSAAELCNEPLEAARAELSRVTGLHKYLFTRIVIDENEQLLLVTGFDKERAAFQPPFDEAHPAQLANLGQHIAVLLRNAKLVTELERDKERLQRFNETLEHKVEERTAELGRKNRDMRLVLDNVDQGFITLSPDGSMATERSRIMDTWFGTCASSIPVWQYLATTSPEFAEQLQLGWEQLRDGFMPPDACLGQFATLLATEEQTFRFQYSPFFRDAQLECVLVIVNDITGVLARERDEEEQRELMQSFKQLTLDRAGFMDFMRETSAMVTHAARAAASGDHLTLLRTIHTLKGNAATLGHSRIASLCHSIEDAWKNDGEQPVQHLLAELAQRWRTITEHVGQIIGGTDDRRLEVNETDYARLIKLLRNGGGTDEALDELLAWRLEPLSRNLERLGEQAAVLARRAGLEVEVKLEPTWLRLDPERWKPLFSELSHVVRNAVAHGFQAEDERKAQGKPAPNKFWLAAEARDGALVLELGDDGRGIDWQALRTRALAGGLPAESASDLVRALFHDGISTRKEADEISGRGIGMSAVKARVDAMKGSIEVRSAPSRGTTWILTIPILHANDVRRLERSPESTSN
jgi:two-component system chemotaxis sensor kinase CheA